MHLKLPSPWEPPNHSGKSDQNISNGGDRCAKKAWRIREKKLSRQGGKKIVISLCIAISTVKNIEEPSEPKSTKLRRSQLEVWILFRVFENPGQFYEGGWQILFSVLKENFDGKVENGLSRSKGRRQDRQYLRIRIGGSLCCSEDHCISGS